MPTLSQYITETRRLLHDSTGQYWSDAELTDYINDARYRVVGDTGCNRVLQTIYLSAGIEVYTYGSVTGFAVTNGGSGYATAPTVVLTGGGGTGATAVATLTNGAVTAVNITNGGVGYALPPTVTFTGGGGSSAAATASVLNPLTIDILNFSVIWGTQRIALNYMPFTKFNALLRVWQNVLDRPCTFSMYSQNSVYLGPIPDQFYVAEADSVVLPSTLVNTTDVDSIIYPWTSPVAYYASYKAKIKEQSYQESEAFKTQYTEKLQEAFRSTMTRRIPNSY